MLIFVYLRDRRESDIDRERTQWRKVTALISYDWLFLLEHAQVKDNSSFMSNVKHKKT